MVDILNSQHCCNSIESYIFTVGKQFRSDLKEQLSETSEESFKLAG